MSQSNGKAPKDSRGQLLHLITSQPEDKESWLPLLAACFIESEERHEKLQNRIFGNDEMQEKGLIQEMRDQHKKIDDDILALNKRLGPIVKFHKRVMTATAILAGPLTFAIGWAGSWVREHFKIH